MATTMLLVPVPEAAVLIDPFRHRLDPSAPQGMPAHVTVLVPFMAPDHVNGGVLGSLEELFAGLPAFDFSLGTTRWFDDRVLYLAPEPAEPFRTMTRAVVQRFPDYPPYEGLFEDIVPHVTIGEGGRWRRRRRAMRRAAARFAGMDPIRARAAEVWLLEISEYRPRWEQTATFALGAADAPGAPDHAPHADVGR